MATSTLFANNTSPTGPQLDAVLAQLAAATVIACTMSGSANTLVLAPLSSAATFAGYSNMQAFAATSTAFNTGPVTVQVGTFAALNVYNDTERGPVLLEGGEIATNNGVVFLYDVLLNNGAGGFHLVNPTQQMSTSNTVTVNNTSGTTLTAVQLTAGVLKQSIIIRTGTNSGGFNDTTDTAANILATLTGAIATVTTFRFRYWNNGTGQTATLVGGTNVTINGPATIANNASHDFIGVITEVSPTPMVSIYG